MHSDLSRRSFLAGSTAGAAAATLLGSLGQGPSALAAEVTEPMSEPLKAGSVVLFQGDSITDAGRDRRSQGPNNAAGLGNGYPFLLACDLLRDHADPTMKVLNRGISGHKVPDLAARWQQDCLDLKPDVLSILVGVNDIWHKLNGNYDGTVATYDEGFRTLLEQTIAALPETTIVICEPFVLRTGAVKENWFPEFDERRAVAKNIAKDLELTFVPFQSMFDEAFESAPLSYWAGDGVHPTLAGHALMAKTWRKVTGL